MTSTDPVQSAAPGPPPLARLLDRPVLFLLIAAALLALYTYGTVDRFRSLPSPLYGGDLYYQQGVVEHILAGGNPLTSSSIPGGVPVYLPLCPALVAALAFLFRLTAYDGLRYFAVLIAFLTPLAWYLPFRKLTGSAWWSVLGSLTGGSRRVVWTQEALEKAARFLAANPDTVPGLALSDDGSAEKTAPGAAGTQSGPSTEIVTVHRWKFPKNVHVIQAKRSTGEVINVLVRSNRNFREVDWRGRTMKLEVFKDTTCWRIKGNCPRWPGKW